MTELELKYLSIINAMNNTSYSEEDMPDAYDVAISKLIKSHEKELGIASESTQDMSVAYSQDTITALVNEYIWPYKRWRW